MTTVVVYTEELSARIVIGTLVRRFLPEAEVHVIAFEGKNDLDKNVGKQIAAWRHPPDTRFVILRDNDGGDCAALKQKLLERVDEDRRDRTRVRIVMQELEDWYLGDPVALAEAGLVTRAVADREARRHFPPQGHTNAKQKCSALHQVTGQITIAERVGPHLDPVRCRSPSLGLLMRTLEELAA